MQDNIPRLKHLGKKYGWKLLCETADALIFQKMFVVLKISLSEMEIETMLNHPKKGYTLLNRKGAFSMNLIEKIFRNPRVHTPKNIKAEYKK